MQKLDIEALSRRIFLGKDRQDPTGERHHESNLVWGPLGIGVSIVLTVIAAMKHDLRFLFYVAWPCFVFGIWRLCKRFRYQNLAVWIACGLSVLVALGLFMLSRWLDPHSHRTQSESAISFKADLAVGHRNGDVVAGIKWSAPFYDIRLTAENPNDEPMQNIYMSVRTVADNGKSDMTGAVGQISDIEGVSIQPVEDIPPFKIRGKDGGSYVLSLRDYLQADGTIVPAATWKVSCLRLYKMQLRLVVAAVDVSSSSGKVEPPKRIELRGQYEIAGETVTFDKMIDVD